MKCCAIVILCNSAKCFSAWLVSVGWKCAALAWKDKSKAVYKFKSARICWCWILNCSCTVQSQLQRMPFHRPPKNTQVTDDTDLCGWPSKSYYPCRPAIPISWVLLQCGQSWFPAAGGPSVSVGTCSEMKCSDAKRWSHRLENTSSSPTLEIRMMSAGCSTWGSSWEIFKCMNQPRSRWSYPDTAHSLIHEPKRTIKHLIYSLKGWQWGFQKFASMWPPVSPQLNPESTPPCETLRAVRSLWEVI